MDFRNPKKIPFEGNEKERIKLCFLMQHSKITQNFRQILVSKQLTFPLAIFSHKKINKLGVCGVELNFVCHNRKTNYFCASQTHKPCDLLTLQKVKVTQERFRKCIKLIQGRY